MTKKEEDLLDKDFFDFMEDVVREQEEKELMRDNCQKLSIFQLMEQITKQSARSELSNNFFHNVSVFSNQLGKLLGLTPVQSVLYSLFLENYDNAKIKLRDISHKTNANMLRIAQLQKDIDELEKKHLIRRTHNLDGFLDGSSLAYSIPFDSIKALQENRPYVPLKKKDLNFYEFMHELIDCVKQWIKLGEPYELFEDDINELVKNNQQLKVAKQLESLKKDLDLSEWLFLIVICVGDYNRRHSFTLSEINKKFEECYNFAISVNTGNCWKGLFEKDLIEYGCCDGIADNNMVALTRKARKLLLSENKCRDIEAPSNDVLDNKKIMTKPLYYDKEVKEQIDRLNDLLSKNNFNEICKRLKANNMRQGFTCLFYGAPGTGKTETVLQLAKKTGRNIVQVNLSEIKDKFVGESEKNIKAVFDNYRQIRINEKNCPILLFNEADAIIGKRLENVERSVDQMNNSIQNIILQEMETFEGILIATTNLAGNMDPAFERRFLYKVRFEKPSCEVRKMIWKGNMPTISEEIALALAKEFDFSGGQIENIARKRIVDSILYGESEDVYSSLREYCMTENLQKSHKVRPNIGFAA